MGHKAGFTQQGELVRLYCPVGGRRSLWKRLLGERRLKLSLWESEEEFKKGETARMKDWGSDVSPLRSPSIQLSRTVKATGCQGPGPPCSPSGLQHQPAHGRFSQ